VSEPAFVLRARLEAEELEWLEHDEARVEVEGEAVEAERHESRTGLPPEPEDGVRYRKVTVERSLLGTIEPNER
jgi:hypothetical protein